MNIVQIAKEYEDYKNGLEQALHKVDGVKQKLIEDLVFFKP